MAPNLRLLIVELGEGRSSLGERLTRVADVAVVGCARSIDEALQFVREAEPAVVLINMGSWDLDATPFCKEFRRASSLPVAVLASFMAPQRWEKLKRAGASELLLRGTPTAQVVETLRGLAS